MTAPDVTGAQLVEALLAAGWQRIGWREGAYERLAFVEGRGTSHHLVVPLDESAPEYQHMFDGVLWHLERLVDDGRSAQKALDRIAGLSR